MIHLYSNRYVKTFKYDVRDYYEVDIIIIYHFDINDNFRIENWKIVHSGDLVLTSEDFLNIKIEVENWLFNEELYELGQYQQELYDFLEFSFPAGNT